MGTYGQYPPNPIPNACILQENCYSDSYDNSLSHFYPVCLQCSDIKQKPYRIGNFPFLVQARSIGKTRENRLLLE